MKYHIFIDLVNQIDEYCPSESIFVRIKIIYEHLLVVENYLYLKTPQYLG